MDPLKKASHKKKQMDEKLKFIEAHPLPSQEKRKVFGKEGEEERLLTVLWHDLTMKAGRRAKGHHDDDSD